jgi:hypothetical protein
MGSEGIAINSLSGVKIGMILEEPPITSERGWRVYSIGTFLMGRDEKVLISRDVLSDISDPLFHRIRDTVLVDILLQIELPNITPTHNSTSTDAQPSSETKPIIDIQNSGLGATNLFSSLLQQLTSVLREPVATFSPDPAPKINYKYIDMPAITPTGIGVAPLPDVREAPNPNITPEIDSLSWGRVYFADQACQGKLPDAAPKLHQVIVMRRGGCSFSNKLATIPSFAPSRSTLQLVIVVSDDKESLDEDAEDVWGFNLIRPLLDEEQRTPAGVIRHRPIAMLMVGGGEATYELLKSAKSIGMRRRYHVESQGLMINNLVVL